MQIKVPDHIKNNVTEYLKTHNIGNRGYGNGNSKQQFCGLIAEWVVYSVFYNTCPEMKPNGFDGGYDFFYKGKYIDVKTRLSSYYAKPYFQNSFFACQMKYKADTIIFCSYNTTEDVVEIMGWMNKNEIQQVGKFWSAGTKRSNPSGASLVLKLDEYQVMNSQLHDIKTLLYEAKETTS